jgi:streptogramin lyase
MFDAKTETFIADPREQRATTAASPSPSDGMVWVATNNGGTHGCGLNQIDSNTMTHVQFHNFPQCGTPVGVSIDVDGFVWMVDHNGWAYRIDPETYEKDPGRDPRQSLHLLGHDRRRAAKRHHPQMKQ